MTTNQAFLQGLLSAKVLKRKQTTLLWNRCCDKTNKVHLKLPAETGDGLEAVISRINRNLEMAGIQIRSVYNYYEKTQFFGLVNTEEDTAVKKGTKYDKKDIEFFKRLTEEILEEVTEPFDEEDISTLGIPLPVAQNLAKEVEGIRISEAAELIQYLHKERWLMVIKKPESPTTVTFGTRSLLELPDVRKWSMERQTAGQELDRRDGREQGRIGNNERPRRGADDDSFMEIDHDEEIIQPARARRTRRQR